MAAGERREYRGAAAATTLNGAVAAGDTTIPLVNATGWPDGSVGPFFIVIDPGLAAEEKVKCISRTGNSLTVVTSPSSGRGADSTIATTHVSGAAVQHVWTADDADKHNAHINDLNDNHQSLLNVTRHDVTARHPLGTVISTGTPGTSAVGDTPATGVATSAARSDHTHGREGFATPAIALGTSAAAGSASTLIRSNATIAAFDVTNPTTSSVGDAAAVGSAAVAARRDHRHAREAFGSAVAVGSALSAGSSTSVAHADHVHNAPLHLQYTGFTGAIIGGTPPSGGPFYCKSGVWTAATNGSGDIAISFPNGAFPNGVISVDVSPMLTAGPATPCYPQISSVTTTTLTIHFGVLDGGGHIIGATGQNVTFTYQAIGW